MSKPTDQIITTRAIFYDAVLSALARGYHMGSDSPSRIFNGKKVRQPTVEQLDLEVQKIIKSIS